jgi:hypothetical protein
VGLFRAFCGLHICDQKIEARAYQGMTRIEIEGLRVGDVLERTVDLIPHSGLKAKEGARYGMRGAVTEISFRGVSVHGRAYVGGYTAFGAGGSSMSFSVSEGEEIVRFAPADGVASS